MTTAVLLVEEDVRMGERIERWLEADGYAVLNCSGPTHCSTTGSTICPLAEAADAIVLDVRFDADAVMEGMPGWQLLDAYRVTTKPIVVLTGPEQRAEIDHDAVVVIGRTAGREELRGALRAAADRRHAAGRPPMLTTLAGTRGR